MLAGGRGAQERLAAVVRVGLGTHEVGGLQGGDDLAHGLRAYVLILGQPAGGGGALEGDPPEGGELRGRPPIGRACLGAEAGAEALQGEGELHGGFVGVDSVCGHVRLLLDPLAKSTGYLNMLPVDLAAQASDGAGIGGMASVACSGLGRWGDQ